MSSKRHSVPALHEWHLEPVLRELGLLKEIDEGTAICQQCTQSITLNNLSGIVVLGGGKYSLVCNRPDCIATSSGTYSE